MSFRDEGWAAALFFLGVFGGAFLAWMTRPLAGGWLPTFMEVIEALGQGGEGSTFAFWYLGRIILGGVIGGVVVHVLGQLETIAAAARRPPM